MLPRVLEPEVMDTPEEARDYDAMDHSAVNRAFVADFLRVWHGPGGYILDVGTGTAQIPIELCSQDGRAVIVAIDLSEHMLVQARRNVERAGFAGRIQLVKMDAKGIYYHPRAFAAVVSNSIIHHIPEPAVCLAAMSQVCAAGGTLFVRDLMRPPDIATLNRLVDTYAAGANDHQRQMFADSLHAALTVDEVRRLVADLGFDPATVQATTDRHWTWAAVA
jgi:ubiquinone/menaquinone biosynthesis C-methylase UbiE